MKIYRLNGEKKAKTTKGYWEYRGNIITDYESLTSLYEYLPQNIKEDFYNNKFDGDWSRFYLIGPYIKSGLLVKKLDIPGKENDKTKYCFVYGLAMTKLDYTSKKKAMMYFLRKLWWDRLKKHFNIHLFSYVIIRAEDIEQENICKELGFIKISYDNLYYLSLKYADRNNTPYLFYD